MRVALCHDLLRLSPCSSDLYYTFLPSRNGAWGVTLKYFKDLAKFMLSGVVGLIVATASLLILNQFMDIMLAKLLSIFIGLLFNFTLAKYFVFNKPSTDKH